MTDAAKLAWCETMNEAAKICEAEAEAYTFCGEMIAAKAAARCARLILAAIDEETAKP